jgi:hypothetical protein
MTAECSDVVLMKDGRNCVLAGKGEMKNLALYGVGCLVALSLNFDSSSDEICFKL